MNKMLNSSYLRDDDSVFLPNSPKVINDKSKQVMNQAYTEVVVDNKNLNASSIRQNFVGIRNKTNEPKQVQLVHKIEKAPININVAVRDYFKALY